MKMRYHSKRPGYIESLLKDYGIIIAPQPTKYNSGLKIKITRNGKLVPNKQDKTYAPKQCFKQIEIIKQWYYDRLTAKKETK